MSTSPIFKSPSVIRQQHEGPLGIHIDAHEALLGEHGYSFRSAYVHLHIVSDLNAHLALKEAAFAKTRPLTGKQARFRPSDKLLEFLTAL